MYPNKLVLAQVMGRGGVTRTAMRPICCAERPAASASRMTLGSARRIDLLPLGLGRSRTARRCNAELTQSTDECRAAQTNSIVVQEIREHISQPE